MPVLNIRKITAKFFLLFVFLFALPSVSHAQGADAGMLTNITQQYLDAASSWTVVIKRAATYLFFTLGAISLVWTGITLLFKKADIAEFFSEFIRFILFFGFMLWLLSNGELMGKAIIDSLMSLGGQAGGNSIGGSPSAVLQLGFEAYKRVSEATSIWSPMQSAIMIIVALAILAIIALIAVNMAILIISAWFIVYAGIFFLGFGGSRWTSDIAINYFKNVLNLSIQLLAMTLLVSIGQTFLKGMVDKYTTGEMNLEAIGIVTVAALILLVLTSKIPGMLGAIASGGSVGNASNGGLALGGAVAGMAVAATGLAMAAKELGAAVAGNAMGAKASVSAALAKAESAIGGQGGGDDASTPDVSGMGGGGGGDNGGGSNNFASGGSSESGTGSISQGSSTSDMGQDGASGQDGSGESGRAGDGGKDGTSGQDGETEVKTDQTPQSESSNSTQAGSDSSGNENADSFTTPDVTGQQSSETSGGNPNSSQPSSDADNIPPTRLNKGAYAAGAMVGAVADIAKTSATNKMTQLRDSSTLGRFAKHIEGDKPSESSMQSRSGKSLANRAAEIGAYVNKAHKSTDW